MRSCWATMRAAFAEAISNRSAFWTQIAAMLVNDVVWVAFWLLFFDQVHAVGGWDCDGVLMLLAVLTTSGGLVLGLFSNTRRLGQLVGDGGLDAVLALPVRPLPALLVRRVDPVNLGDVVFGIVLFVVSGDLSLERVVLFVGVSVLGATVLAAFLVLTGSLGFFARGSEAGDLGFNAMLMLAAYPVDVFAGVAKTLVFTVVPAAFVATVPARIVVDFDVRDLALLAFAAFAFALAAWTTFTIGLRRYTGTALWTWA
jgi:ABC-2 type transport system permease protein